MFRVLVAILFLTFEYNVAHSSVISLGIDASGLSTKSKERNEGIARFESKPDSYNSDQTSLIASIQDSNTEMRYSTKLRSFRFKRNILIIMSDTGGGHRASADALLAALNSLYPGQFNTSIVDIWTEYGPWPYNTLVQTYRFLGRRPILWRLTYELGRFPPFRCLSELWCGLVCWGGVARCFQDYKPDLIVSVHPLCQQLPLKVLKGLGGGKKNIPFVTVVTDLASCHPTWFHKSVDTTYVPTDILRDMAYKSGIQKEKVRLTGLPLRPQFWSKSGLPNKTRVRSKLNLLPGAPTAVLVGGGEGVGKLSEIAQRTADQLSLDLNLSQLIIVCGKNEAIQRSLSSRKWPTNVHVTILGFIPNLDSYMSAADVVVTKAGPGTIAEACALGVPLILSSYMPGQEKGNVPFVTKGKFGFYERCPKGIARSVSSLLRDQSKLEEMSKNAMLAGRPLATLSIATDMIQSILPSLPQ